MIPVKLRTENMRFVLLKKEGKIPIQSGWQKADIRFNDSMLLGHIKNGGNYGVRGGGLNNLIVVDFDDEKVQEKIIPQLPKTFTVKSGRGLLHKYFYSNNSISYKILDREKKTLIDIQGEGKQVVGANSIHENGNKYEVVDDSDIAFIPYSELQALIMPFDFEQVTRGSENVDLKKGEMHEEGFDDFIEKLKSALPIEKVLSYLGVDVSKNPTTCPFHSSNGGKCLGFQREVAHCFHCEGRWNIFSLMKQSMNCDFKSALEKLSELAGMNEELEQSRKDYTISRQENITEDITKEDKEILELRMKYVALISGRERDWAKASELLVGEIEREKFIYTTRSDEKPEMWIYDDGVYLPEGKSKVREELRKILGEWYNIYIANLVLAKIEGDTSIEANEFFRNKYVDEIPIKNGILNIFTRKLSEYNPKKIFFNKLPLIYDPEKKCPQIDSFFRSVLKSEDDVKVIYELAGFSLLSEYRFEKIFMMVGDGRNGKGKTLELFRRFVGAENCKAIPLTSLVPNSFNVADLFGKRLNLAGDIGDTDLKETATLKSLSARDSINGQRKFLSSINFENYAKLVFACNSLPTPYDTSRGFWDRWVLLEFPYTFVSKKEYDETQNKQKLKIRDENIINNISSEDELSGFLNIALDGLDRLNRNKGFSGTIGCSEIKKLWIRKANSFIAFSLDCIEEDYDSYLTKRELRKKYSEYCKKHKIHIKSDFVIKKVLTGEYGSNDEYISVPDSSSIYKKQEWVWRGIKWK